jgi:hypothetical protein
MMFYLHLSKIIPKLEDGHFEIKKEHIDNGYITITIYGNHLVRFYNELLWHLRTIFIS